ncbi:hypothetical protein [[Mycoplasma] anseris]|uniref:Uncharacterized protein n=1 Tax=[Mycoplasma] anseris TaxID=92400 RepID=A0A2Z4NCW7_9BACT|nr:hypothetical protein [[Mycoplasma] anseris]AWX69347.1 hypothetical protein DP065_01075 [[Mycoplasma] anseris]
MKKKRVFLILSVVSAPIISSSLISAKTDLISKKEDIEDRRIKPMPGPDYIPDNPNSPFGGGSYIEPDFWTKEYGYGDHRIYVDFNNWKFHWGISRYDNYVHFNKKAIETYTSEVYPMKPLYDILTIIYSFNESHTYNFLTFDFKYWDLLEKFVRSELNYIKKPDLDGLKIYYVNGLKLFTYVMNILENDPMFELNIPFWFKMFYSSADLKYDNDVLDFLIEKSPFAPTHFKIEKDKSYEILKPRTIEFNSKLGFWELRKKIREDFENELKIFGGTSNLVKNISKVISKVASVANGYYFGFAIARELLISLNALLGEDWTNAYHTNNIDFYIDFEKTSNWRGGNFNERNQNIRKYFKNLESILIDLNLSKGFDIKKLIELLGYSGVHYETKIKFFDKIIEHEWNKVANNYFNNAKKFFNWINNSHMNGEKQYTGNVNFSFLDKLPKLELINNGFTITDNLKNIKFSILTPFIFKEASLQENSNLNELQKELFEIVNNSNISIWKGALLKNLNDLGRRISQNDFQLEHWRRNVFEKFKNDGAAPIIFLNTFFKKELYSNIKSEFDINGNNKVIIKYDIKKKITKINNKSDDECISRGW